MFYLLIGLASYLVIANILISRYVWRDSQRTMTEKIAETGLVWLVPFFGHLLALAISLEGPETVRKTDLTTVAGGAVGAVAGTS
ncbi:MAG: hypothetical protein ACNA7J_09140 [Wenzhouxiangella sp.]